jgi:hypothetical protein
MGVVVGGRVVRMGVEEVVEIAGCDEVVRGKVEVPLLREADVLFREVEDDESGSVVIVELLFVDALETGASVIVVVATIPVVGCGVLLTGDALETRLVMVVAAAVTTAEVTVAAAAVVVVVEVVVVSAAEVVVGRCEVVVVSAAEVVVGRCEVVITAAPLVVGIPVVVLNCAGMIWQDEVSDMRLLEHFPGCSPVQHHGPDQVGRGHGLQPR